MRKRVGYVNLALGKHLDRYVENLASGIGNMQGCFRILFRI